MTDREQSMDLESAIKVLRQVLRQGKSLMAPATGVADSIVDQVWPVVEYLEARQEDQEETAEDLESAIKMLGQLLRQGKSLKVPATVVAQSTVDEAWAAVMEYLEARLEETAEDEEAKQE